MFLPRPKLEPKPPVGLLLHVVFSTKNREKLFNTTELEIKIHANLAGICTKMNAEPLEVGGTENHVHLLCAIGHEHSVAELVRELKLKSALWVKQHPVELPRLDWQKFYGAFSISPSHVGSLKTYIKNQREHHREETFQDEMRRLFTKYGIEYDEEHVWR